MHGVSTITTLQTTLYGCGLEGGGRPFGKAMVWIGFFVDNLQSAAKGARPN
jgi:hypothetical protein